MKKLTKKQEFIVNLIQERGLASTQEILKRFTNTFDTISRQTLIRILNNLIEERWLIREGKGRGIHYRTLLATPLLSYIDPEKYFKIPPDERKTLTSHFNWDVFEHFEPIFSKDELLHLHQISQSFVINQSISFSRPLYFTIPGIRPLLRMSYYSSSYHIQININ